MVSNYYTVVVIKKINRMGTHMHTCTHTWMHMCTHTWMHTCTHTHMDAHTHECTHTHTYMHINFLDKSNVTRNWVYCGSCRYCGYCKYRQHCEGPYHTTLCYQLLKLQGGHTLTNTQTDFLGKSNFKKSGMLAFIQHEPGLINIIFQGFTIYNLTTCGLQ